MFSCLLCQRYIGLKGEWCPGCHDDLPWNQHCCLRCAEPWGTPFNGLCAQCTHTEPEFDSCHAPFVYDFPINQLLLSGKSGIRAELLLSLARTLATSIQQNNVVRPQLLVPVPLHPYRQSERGYNQSGIIAKTLGNKLKIPVSYTLVRKIKDSVQQKSLSRAERQVNLQRTYRVNRALLREEYPALSHIALIDDVITTGSTLNQIAAQFRRSGIERVDGWAVARTSATNSF